MKELFYDFVAPVHHSNTIAVRKQMQRSGAGGIRGIQHQSALYINDNNNNHNNNNININHNMIIRNIKPGQAIRVQPSLKKKKNLIN